jgi:hypothetical protein
MVLFTVQALRTETCTILAALSRGVFRVPSHQLMSTPADRVDAPSLHDVLGLHVS